MAFVKHFATNFEWSVRLYWRILVSNQEQSCLYQASKELWKPWNISTIYYISNMFVRRQMSTETLIQLSVYYVSYREKISKDIEDVTWSLGLSDCYVYIQTSYPENMVCAYIFSSTSKIDHWSSKKISIVFQKIENNLSNIV